MNKKDEQEVLRMIRTKQQSGELAARYDGDQTLAAKYEQRESARQGARRFWKRLRIVPVLLVCYVLLASADLGSLLSFLQPAEAVEREWNLILVNGECPIPGDYDMELMELANGQMVDRRIYPDLQEMFDTMREQGVYPVVASGYRTEEKQRALLEEKTQSYIDAGHTWRKARELALQWVAEPGTSEHQLGIAVDINQEGTRSTAAEVYEWLEDNAHYYGFIYRYPPEKTEITGVSNEPWHYRYVGVEAAMEIYEMGVTLEEYLEGLDP